MAVLNINISNISNGQEIILPFEVTGSINAPANPPPPLPVTLAAAARQIDDNALATITVPPVPPPPPPNPTNLPVLFSFEVAAAECPDVNAWYMLTIYAWDNQGDCTLQSVTFKRVAEPGSPVLPPPGSPPPPPPKPLP